MIEPGTYAARAISAAWGKSSKGNVELITEFEVEGGNGRITHRFYFTDGAAARSLESLRYMGLQGEDLSTIGTGEDGALLGGIGDNVVEIVVEHEDYTNDAGHTTTRARVKWVNRLSAAVKNPLSAEDLKAFSAAMRGKIREVDKKLGTGAAPAPAPAQPHRQAQRPPQARPPQQQSRPAARGNEGWSEGAGYTVPPEDF